eukprot:jgi/Psemu1/54156/gm1.54156_g
MFTASSRSSYFCTPSPSFKQEYKRRAFHYQNWVPEEDTPTFSCRYTPVKTSSPKKGKASLISLSLGSRDFNLEGYLTVTLYSSTSSSSPSIATDEEDDKQENKINNYANQANTGKGHYVRRIKLSELVHFDGIVYVHGALEGKKGSICYRWTNSNLKLNCNHEAKYNRQLCKDNMNKFNYAYKFDSFMKLLFTTSITSARRHAQICDIFTKYVMPEIGKLWSSSPYLTADNFVNGDLILDGMGGLGFGMIGTVAQIRLPKTVGDKYFHKENVSSASGKRCLRIARLCNPATMLAG